MFQPSIIRAALNMLSQLLFSIYLNTENLRILTMHKNYVLAIKWIYFKNIDFDLVL